MGSLLKESDILFIFFNLFSFGHWILYLGLSLSSQLLPLSSPSCYWTQNTKGVFFFKISIWIINNVSLLYITYYIAENFYLSIHLTGVCPYLLEYFYKVLLSSFSQINVTSVVSNLILLVIFFHVNYFSDSFYAKQFWIIWFSFWIVHYETVSCLNPIEYVGIFVILTENQPSWLRL